MSAMEFDLSQSECETEGDSSNDSNDSSNDDSSDESSFDEMSVGIGLDLPKRANRSKKFTELVGEGLEKDQQFWGHSTWEEEKEDEDYNCSEGESFYEYETDSDFDDSESEEETEVVEVVEKRKKRHKTRSYVDPATLRAKKQSTKEHTGVKKIKPTISIEYGIANRSKRDTTIRKTEAIIAQQERDKIISEARRATKRVKRENYGRKLPTQEELLEEAMRTEAMNRESLEALLASEIEKKRYTKYTRQKAKGHYDIWICWNSLVSIIKEEINEPIIERALEMYFFTNGKIPEIYEQNTSIEPKDIRCVVTGNRAKYIDPLTKLPFDSVDSFKRIREEYRLRLSQSNL